MRAGRARRYALTGATILGVLVTVALAAPLLAPYEPGARVGVPFSPPSADHLLGTNDVGQDLLSVLLFGARISLLVGTVAALAATTIGATVGVTAGYAGGWVDALLMRIVDVMLALPVLPLAIVLGVFLGPGSGTQILVIAAVIWAGTARELRAQVLSVREREHIQAQRAMGARPGHVVRRHVVPSVAPLVVPQFVLATKTAIVLAASLAFLGLGDMSAKSWGTMLSFAHARSAFLTDAWLWWVVPPGLAIAATVLAFALLGYAFEERARPALREATPDLRRAAPRAAGPLEAPLVIDGLSVAYGREQALAVDRVSLHVGAGELVGLVGETGSGKSTVAGAAAGMLPAAATPTAGHVLVGGHDLAGLAPAELRRMRGTRVALVPQEAMSALNPVLTIGDQLFEALAAPRYGTRTAKYARVTELLEQVALDRECARCYPHQLSGGMRQRVVIAMALANHPAVVVADEPTSGLDVLVAAELLDLLDGLRRQEDLALLVVSHDLPMVSRVAERVAVMRHGQLVETGTAPQVTTAPQHAYTRSLVEAAPRLRLPAQVSTRC